MASRAAAVALVVACCISRGDAQQLVRASTHQHAQPHPAYATIFRSNFSEPPWVAIYHIPVLLSVPLSNTTWRLMAFAEARECAVDGRQTCDPALAADGGPKGLAFRHADLHSAAARARSITWVPALGTPPRFLDRDTEHNCCLNLGAAVFDEVISTVFLHYARVGAKIGALLMSSDFGISWTAHAGYAAQLKAAGMVPFAPGPGIGIQLQWPTSHRHRILVCGQGKSQMSAVCLMSNDHGKHWLAAGGAEVDNNLTLPSEASVVELRGGNVLMNTRNSCHRLHAPNNCCWGPGCYDRAGVPHCHGPIACNHAHDHHHTRVLTVSTDAGASFSRPRWCDALPDPDCEGSMARDIQTGDLLFANNRDGTIGGRDNMTVYRARAGSGGACLAWHVLQQVDVGPAGYSCIASLPSRQLGVLYEHAWSAERAAHNDRDRTNLVFQLVAT